MYKTQNKSYYEKETAIVTPDVILSLKRLRFSMNIWEKNIKTIKEQTNFPNFMEAKFQTFEYWKERLGDINPGHKKGQFRIRTDLSLLRS